MGGRILAMPKGFEPEMEMFFEMQYEVTRSCTIDLAEFGVDSKEKEGRFGWKLWMRFAGSGIRGFGIVVGFSRGELEEQSRSEY